MTQVQTQARTRSITEIQEQARRQVDAWSEKTPASRAAWLKARKHVPGGVSGNFRFMDPNPMFAARARGSRLWDLDGNEYIDFMLNMGSQFVGHSHPVVVRAISEQAERGTLFCMPHLWEAEVAEQLGFADRRLPIRYIAIRFLPVRTVYQLIEECCNTADVAR